MKMAKGSTAGVTAVATILERLTRKGSVTVSQLIDDGVIARSTAFDVVRRLRDAGLIKDALHHRLTPGPELVKLGFARLGLEALCGPAEAVLKWLRDQTNSTVVMTAPEADVELLRFDSTIQRDECALDILSSDICRLDRTVAASIRIEFFARCATFDRLEFEALLSRCTITLEQHLAARHVRVDGAANTIDRAAGFAD